MGVNMSCKEETCESIDIAMSINKLKNAEKLENMQILIQKESP